MKRVTLEELLYKHSGLSYNEQYGYIMLLIEKGKIKPVASSETNGKKPALYLKYWVMEEKKDYSDLEEELKYRLHPMIQVDYYLNHPQAYEKDRNQVRQLDKYLRDKKDSLKYKVSVNERSFEIWGREKFLSGENGKKILKRCGLTMEDMNIYHTLEPLSYYSRTKDIPQNLLILENKDTFYSMRQHLMNGSKMVFGKDIGTLIYGAGKRCISSFRDFNLAAEPYMKDKKNIIYYFGDLDYEGIMIYESLASQFLSLWEIIPFVPAYEAMLEKFEGNLDISELPETKENQNRHIKDIFFSYFPIHTVERMKNILESDKYIPQEILNITDF